jgi:glutathione S-transferase
MKLFYAPDSIAVAAHIALEESGLDFSIERIDHHAKVCADGSSYLAINPRGYVPALALDDGTILVETIAILLYIADLAPESRLGGGAGINRYRVLEWMSFVVTEIHQRFMRFPQPGLSAELAEATTLQLRSRFDNAACGLSASHFLVGSNLTIADILLFTSLRWCHYRSIDIGEWKSLAAFVARMNRLPAVARALDAERA